MPWNSSLFILGEALNPSPFLFPSFLHLPRSFHRIPKWKVPSEQVNSASTCVMTFSSPKLLPTHKSVRFQAWNGA